MSDQNFENQHPRNRKGEFTDKPGSGPTTESDVALGGPVVVVSRVRLSGRAVM